MPRPLAFLVFAVLALGGEGDPVVAHGEAVRAPRAVRVEIDLDTAVAEVDARFLSFAVDTTQWLGGSFWSPSGEVEIGRGKQDVAPYDFARPQLRRLTRALAPALLRIGGSDADLVYVDLSETPRTVPPPGYEHVLTAARWDALTDFARDTDLGVMLTFDGGPGPRDAQGNWEPQQARALLAHAASRRDPLAVAELGNEPNAYPLIHGLRFDPSVATHAADQRRFSALVREVLPSARVAGPGAAFWPLIGEPHALEEQVLALAGAETFDIVTWHYYPQQSRRCGLAVRPAGSAVMLAPGALDEVGSLADTVEAMRTRRAPTAELWLGETGNAQCGGAPGVSDRFAGTFWWVDQLGMLARRGQRVVVRQTLSGSDYGLLDEATLTPRPDYWATLLHHRLAGERVLDVKSPEPTLRAYAHCARGSAPGAVTVMLLDVSRTQAFEVALDALAAGPAEQYTLSADALDAATVSLDGVPLTVDAQGALPSLAPREVQGTLHVAPLTITFVVFPEAHAPACD